MHIVVSTDHDNVTLEEADEFTSFDVLAPESARPRLGDLLSTVGRVEGDHVWVARTAVAELAGAGADDSAWQAGFAAMVDYARSKGFLSDDDLAVRAHIEWGD
jgi:hypothetical protein